MYLRFPIIVIKIKPFTGCNILKNDGKKLSSNRILRGRPPRPPASLGVDTPQTPTVNPRSGVEEGKVRSTTTVKLPKVGFKTNVRGWEQPNYLKSPRLMKVLIYCTCGLWCPGRPASTLSNPGDLFRNPRRHRNED